MELMLFGWIFFFFAMAMPNARWLAGYAIVMGGIIATIHISDQIAASRPDFHSGSGANNALGALIMIGVVLSLVLGVLARAIGLALKRRFPSLLVRTGYFVLATLSLPLPFMLLEYSLNAERRIRASDTCKQTFSLVQVGNAELRLPMTALLSVRAGKWSKGIGEFHLGSDRGQRDICAESQNGERPVRAAAVAFGAYRTSIKDMQACAPSQVPWAQPICKALFSRSLMYDLDFDVSPSFTLLAPGEIMHYGHASTYDFSITNNETASGTGFHLTGIQTPDGKPLTFMCHQKDRITSSCRAAYNRGDGTQLDFEFTSNTQEIEARGIRVWFATEGLLQRLSASHSN